MWLRQCARPVIGILLTVVTAFGLMPGTAAAVGDVDGDGLDDALEDALASRFFPHVWFDSGENSGCTDPATSTNPGTALARVRRHPQDATKIAILYVVLYRRDCGDFLGFGSHHGDVEPFSVTLSPNSSCSHGYGAFSLKTVAHEGTWFEHTDQRLLGNSCTWGRLAGGSPTVARIYSSENKHGNYASDESCDAGAAGFDNCSESFRHNFNVFNVGEDSRRRIDELSAYQFPGEFTWSPVRFSGSLSRGSDAGFIRNKFISDRLLAIGTNPPPSSLCSQPAHAWYENPARGAFVYQGQSILLTAAGVTPHTVVSFHFMRLNGTQAAYYQTRWANDNCVVNQEYMQINAGTFPGGQIRSARAVFGTDQHWRFAYPHRLPDGSGRAYPAASSTARPGSVLRRVWQLHLPAARPVPAWSDLHATTAIRQPGA